MRIASAVVLLSGVLSFSALAQGSVTLFGVVDLNVRSVKNGSAGTLSSLSQDGISSSRLGVRGVEDLGGGIRAQFWLEGFLLPDAGLGSGWTRRSTIGLITPMGEFRFGRDYVPDFWAHTIFDPFGTNGVGSGINLIGAFNGASTFLRANNTVGYLLPAMGGLYGQVQVAAGEGSVGNKHAGARIGYESGPLNVAFAVGRTSVDTVREWSRWNVGASYSLGTVTLSGLFADTRGNGGGGDGQEIRFMLFGVQVPFQSSSIKLAYSRSEGGGVPVSASLDASQFSFGFQHDLSQRTAIYSNVALLKNEGTATYVASSSGPAGIRRGERSTGIEVGLRHVF